MNENRKNNIPLILAFLAGVVVTAILAVFLISAGKQGNSAQAGAPADQESDSGPDFEAGSETGAESDTEMNSKQTAGLDTETDSETAEGAAVFGKNIDYAEVFPSWNPDSSSLAELVDFVAASTDDADPGYLDPADRIAVFDMDGTILSEKAPVYIDYCLTIYRVLDDPAYEATEEERRVMEQVRDVAYSEGRPFDPEGLNKNDLVATAFAGMTPEEFRAYVVDFADHTDVVGFEGMTYGQSFYQPMIEVIRYLQANDFDVWMVSACEREVVRALVERYDIPCDHVIATDVPYVASKSGEEDADEYNMGQEEQILLGAPLDAVECGKSGKPAAIAREIGKRPVLAFGNSTGDYSMLNYAEGSPDHTGMGFFIVCDDTVREYGNEEKAAEYYAEVEKEGWTPFSMADDWKTIYGENVKKTGLPGTEEALPDAGEALPGSEAAPGSEDASPASEAAPGSEEASPGSEESLPDTEEELPDAEEALPDAA